MIPLPGSVAICAGKQSNIPSGVTTDERGYPNTNTTYSGYNSTTRCVDAGAVQTDYTGGSPEYLYLFGYSHRARLYAKVPTPLHP